MHQTLNLKTTTLKLLNIGRPNLITGQGKCHLWDWNLQSLAPEADALTPEPLPLDTTYWIFVLQTSSIDIYVFCLAMKATATCCLHAELKRAYISQLELTRT